MSIWDEICLWKKENNASDVDVAKNFTCEVTKIYTARALMKRKTSPKAKPNYVDLTPLAAEGHDANLVTVQISRAVLRDFIIAGLK